MQTLQDALSETSVTLDRVMGELLPSNLQVSTKVISFAGREEEQSNTDVTPQGEAKVIEAMRYSALAGGKRLRPFLTVESAKLFGVHPDAALLTAAAIEFVHTYSLVHDDLPAMDNDDFRRGKPSCHKQFGEAAAILAGDALLTFAFEVLSNPPRSCRRQCPLRADSLRRPALPARAAWSAAK